MLGIRKFQIIHHLLFAPRLYAKFHKCSHPVTHDLGGDLEGDPITTQTSKAGSWSNSRCCRLTQRNDRAKHIPLLKLRLCPRIQPCIFVRIAHSRTELIRQTDLAENF